MLGEVNRKRPEMVMYPGYDEKLCYNTTQPKEAAWSIALIGFS